MKKALVDTDILSYFINGNEDVIINFEKYLNSFPTINISAITYFEILVVLEYKNATRQIKNFESLCSEFNVLQLTPETIKISAKEGGRLKRNGIIIGNSDLLIAEVALYHNLEIATNNEKHFKHIETLAIQNWKRSF